MVYVVCCMWFCYDKNFNLIFSRYVSNTNSNITQTPTQLYMYDIIYTTQYNVLFLFVVVVCTRNTYMQFNLCFIEKKVTKASGFHNNIIFY